ncbi:hypothetical protein [Dietzia sp. 179-F 9C3 NHS]
MLLGIVAVLVVALGIAAVRVVNHYRYPEPEVEYPWPRDTASYPAELPG